MKENNIIGIRKAVAFTLMGALMMGTGSTLLSKSLNKNNINSTEKHDSSLCGEIDSEVNVSNNTKQVGNYDSAFYDGFDVETKVDISGKYYVLKLREAWKANCNSELGDMDKHAYYECNNFFDVPEISLRYSKDSILGKNEILPVTDESQVPEYLLLVGTPFEIIYNVPMGAVQYEFTGWNEDYTFWKGWKTDVALLRCAKDDFNIEIYNSDIGISGSLTLDDSYIVPVSSLNDMEASKLLEQYNNDNNVAYIIENRKTDFLDKDYAVELSEEYYVFDFSNAWAKRFYDKNNKICSFRDSDDSHGCVLNDEYSYLNLRASIPRYILLKADDLKGSHLESDGSSTTHFLNYGQILSGQSSSGSVTVNRQDEKKFQVTFNSLEFPLRIEDFKAGSDANCVLMHGSFATTSSCIRPLSSLTKEEIESLVSDYGYDEKVISIVEDYWFNCLLGSKERKQDDAEVMSNGFTSEENAEILAMADFAGVKSKILTLKTK